MLMVSAPYYKVTILCKGPLLLPMKLHLPIGSQHDKSGGKWTFLALLLMGVITLLVAVGSTNKSVGVIQETGSNDTPIMLPPPPVIKPDEIDTLLPPDSIQAINDPRFESADEADLELRPEERVIGVVINGEAKAYPIPILSVHEIVNDVIGGEPVAITWCPLCYTALVFSRRVEGKANPLTFGVSGKLLQNTLVMFDRETNSLWSQLYGAALLGPLEGRRLAVFPSLHTEWRVWQSQHQDTRVLSKKHTCAQFNCGTYADNPRGSYDVDPYESYYQTPYEGVIDHQIPREATSPTAKKRVLGLHVDGMVRAYPFEILTTLLVINDVISENPIVVWFDPDSQTGGAFFRQVDGRTLTFRLNSRDTLLIVDEETGSVWESATGTAIAGPIKGGNLTPVITTPAFEFGWFDYYPESEVYTGID